MPATAPETIRIVMNTSQAGLNYQTDDAGNSYVAGDFVRQPGREYDVPADEGQRLIDKGFAQLAAPATSGGRSGK